MILYPPVTKNHGNLIARENMIDQKMFNKLKPFGFLFSDKEKKCVKKNLDETILYNSI